MDIDPNAVGQVAQTVGEFVKVGKALIERLPNDAKRRELEAALQAAEKAGKQAALSEAKKSGFKICTLHYPGAPMVTTETPGEWVCTECGRRTSPKTSESQDYGRLYWCVKVPRDVSESGEIYAYADSIRMAPNGSLELLRHKARGDELVHEPNVILAPGKWNALYAASVIDGSAVAVEHWAGEVIS